MCGSMLVCIAHQVGRPLFAASLLLADTTTRTTRKDPSGDVIIMTARQASERFAWIQVVQDTSNARTAAYSTSGIDGREEDFESTSNNNNSILITSIAACRIEIPFIFVVWLVGRTEQTSDVVDGNNNGGGDNDRPTALQARTLLLLSRPQVAMR